MAERKNLKDSELLVLCSHEANYAVWKQLFQARDSIDRATGPVDVQNSQVFVLGEVLQREIADHRVVAQRDFLEAFHGAEH